ncbi:MAG TPA: hypothetical protein VJX67_00670, partial [Blastocatellia bacterium]|nr:hypothetical protein [Blastocatellia bacterium]
MKRPFARANAERATLVAALLVLTAVGATFSVARRYFLHQPDFAVPTKDRLGTFPKIVLWAWERPEDLSFIDPKQAGIAFLARTIKLSGDNVTVFPRLQPLNVKSGTALMAVARIETGLARPASLSTSQRDRIVSEIAGLMKINGVSAVQIDFDAKKSERAFYK